MKLFEDAMDIVSSSTVVDHDWAGADDEKEESWNNKVNSPRVRIDIDRGMVRYEGFSVKGGLLAYSDQKLSYVSLSI